MSVQVREKIKGSGIFWIFISHQGIRKSKRIGSKHEAERLAKIVEGRLLSGDLGIDDIGKRGVQKPFCRFADIWVQTIMPASCKPSTAKSYKCIVNKHLKAAPFWNTPVDRITKNEIRTFLLGKRADRTHSTVTNIKKTVSGILGIAVDDNLISDNVCLGITIPKSQGKQSKQRPDPLNERQIEMVLNHFKGHRHYELALFLARVGCRTGEAAALKWADLGLDNRKVTIQRSITHGVISGTKTGKARTVDLTPQVAAALRKLKLRNQKRGAWVFQNQRCNYVDMDNFRDRDFRPALKQLGLPPVRLHDLRHSCATFLIRRTKDIYYAQKQLGHSTITLTVDRYGHLLEEESETRLIDVLDEAAGLW